MGYQVGSFNSQPREGGWSYVYAENDRLTWFQLAATRRRLALMMVVKFQIVCFNSQPREGGWDGVIMTNKIEAKFQLAATRRRLGIGGTNFAL